MLKEQAGTIFKAKILVESAKTINPREILDNWNQNLHLLLTYGVVVNLWRHSVGLTSQDVRKSNSFSRFGHFYSLIRRYDDQIDKNGATVTSLDLKTDPKNKEILSKMICSVLNYDGPQDKKRDLLKEINGFRRKEWQIYETGRKVGNKMSFEETSKYKFESGQPNVLMAARVLEFHFDGLSDEAKEKGRTALTSVIIALQVRDDVKDFLIDRKEQTPNYLGSAIREFPGEEARVEDYLGIVTNSFSVRTLRRLAPSAFDLCDKEFERFLDSAPSELDEMVSLSRARYYNLNSIKVE